MSQLIFSVSHVQPNRLFRYLNNDKIQYVSNIYTFRGSTKSGACVKNSTGKSYKKPFTSKFFGGFYKVFHYLSLEKYENLLHAEKKIQKIL